ncbi:MAG: hypothetical protein SOZ53_06360 [Candidatus Onthovivens sp.]|nr:hypothetical protein [Candidatus Onthovivens sp.]
MKNNILKLTNELNGYIFKIMNENEKLDKELQEATYKLYQALIKLDKIKLITKDEKIIRILEEK